MKDVGIGLIGTGFMGRCHALAFGAVKAVFGDVPTPRLEFLCDPDEEVARRRAEEFGFARATTNWRELIDDSAVEVVSITAPNGVHREMAVAALEAGKHVWCEKPMAPNLDDGRAMAAAARDAGTKTLLGYNYVRNPAILHAKKLIDEGAIGRVVDFRGQIDEDYMADAEAPWTWRCGKAKGGLGVLGDNTCHLVSLAHFLVGDIARLSATTETVHRRRPRADTPSESGVVENEDIAHGILEFAGGATGVIGSSRIAWGRKNLIRIEVHGTKGMIAFDQERMNELELYTAEGDAAARGFRRILSGPEHPPYGRFCPAPGHQIGFNDLKVIEAAHLLGAIVTDATPWPSFEDGLKIEAVIHAMAASAERGEWVQVT